MIILDNIVFSLQKSGGISVVWKNIINALISDNAFRFKCLSYEGEQDNICRKEIRLPDSYQYLVKHRLPLFFERFLNPHITYDQPFVFHSSYYRTCSCKNAINITTVHDFTYEIFRKGLAKWLHCWQKYRAIRHSDIIVCITENTKADLIKYVPDVDKSKIRIIYNGVSSCFKPLKEKKDFGLGQYVLFVGSRVSYKNFRYVVESLKGTSYKLAIVGAPLSEDEKTFIESMISRDSYKVFVHITDKELNELYNSAYCLAYPSSYEGFGIPVLEAQRAGCPVIAFNGSSIPEVIGETPLLLNEISTKEFQCKLNMLEERDLRERIISNGYKNSIRFSWEKMANEYLNLYRELLK